MVFIPWAMDPNLCILVNRVNVTADQASTTHPVQTISGRGGITGGIMVMRVGGIVEIRGTNWMVLVSERATYIWELGCIRSQRCQVIMSGAI